jgi:hypothetical protein
METRLISLRAWAAGVAAAVLGLACAAAPAAAMDSPGALSPLLAKLAKPSVRALPPSRQAEVLGVAEEGPGSLIRRDGGVLVQIRFDRGALAARDDLSEAGAEVIRVSHRYQATTAAVPPGDLREVASTPGVAAVSPVRAPLVFAPANCEGGGSVVSEGVGQLRVAKQLPSFPLEGAREKFSVKGTGTTVGILSDSFDAATEAADRSGPVATTEEIDETTADLPGPNVPAECTNQKTPVKVLTDLGPGGGADEGRAMAQIVHDVAPGASLAFTSAFLGEFAFAESIEELAKPLVEGGEVGAQVIVDDVGYFEEPFFQDGPVATAIENVTSKGVTYLSAAGNDNLIDGEGNNFASWEAPAFRDSGGCPPAVSSIPEMNGTHCMDFNPGPAVDRTFGIKVKPLATLNVDLQWAEPWEGVGTDIDAVLLDANGQPVADSVDNNPANGRPFEYLEWTNESSSEATVQLVLNRFSGTNPLLKFILAQNGSGVSGTEYPRSGGGDTVGPTVFGHAGAAGAIAVGAIRYNATSSPERYSSRGPVTHYFAPFKGPVPAEPIGPQVVSKPDITATDCGSTTFFASLREGAWRFCGTSAAAPHAAGVVALMRQAQPPATTEQLRTALLGTAAPIGGNDPCGVGAGLVEAVGAVEAIKGEAVPVTPQPCIPPNPSGEVFVAPGFWGNEEPPETPVTPSVTPQPTPSPSPAPPATRFVRRPPRVVWTRSAAVRLTLRFGADQAGVTFLCSFDGESFHRCAAKLSRRLRVGRHVVRVKARSAEGIVDPSPAVFRFRIKRLP